MDLARSLDEMGSVQATAAWRDVDLCWRHLRWLREVRGLSKHTVTKYGGVLTAWTRWVNHPSRRHLPIDADLIERFTTRPRKDGIRNAGQVGSPSTRKGDIAALRTFGNWLVREGLVTTNVAQVAVAPTVPTKTPHPISDEDWLKLWLGITDPPARVALGLMGLAGWRRAEVLGLRVEDLHEDGTVTLVRKGADEHSFPLQELLEIIAEKQKAAIVDVSLLPQAIAQVRSDRLSGPLLACWAKVEPSVLNHRLEAWCGLIGITPVNPHRLRDTAITRFLRMGIPLHLAKDLAGHASIDMTLRYARKSGSELAEWRRTAGM